MPESLLLNFDWGDVPTWVGVAGAAVAFSVGLKQYREAQAWKRSEFVASEMEKFFATPRVETACLLIDYYVIRLDQAGRRVVEVDSGWKFTEAVVENAFLDHRRFPEGIEGF